jgi:hypothetical protein
MACLNKTIRRRTSSVRGSTFRMMPAWLIIIHVVIASFSYVADFSCQSYKWINIIMMSTKLEGCTGTIYWLCFKILMSTQIILKC